MASDAPEYGITPSAASYRQVKLVHKVHLGHLADPQHAPYTARSMPMTCPQHTPLARCHFLLLHKRSLPIRKKTVTSGDFLCNITPFGLLICRATLFPMIKQEYLPAHTAEHILDLTVSE